MAGFSCTYARVSFVTLALSSYPTRHDEEGDMNSFRIVPVWETVGEDDVQTPLDIYTELIKLGYPIDYLRIPMFVLCVCIIQQYR